MPGSEENASLSLSVRRIASNSPVVSQWFRRSDNSTKIRFMRVPKASFWIFGFCRCWFFNVLTFSQDEVRYRAFPKTRDGRRAQAPSPLTVVVSPQPCTSWGWTGSCGRPEDMPSATACARACRPPRMGPRGRRRAEVSLRKLCSAPGSASPVSSACCSCSVCRRISVQNHVASRTSPLMKMFSLRHYRRSAQSQMYILLAVCPVAVCSLEISKKEKKLDLVEGHCTAWEKSRTLASSQDWIPVFSFFFFVFRQNSNSKHQRQQNLTRSK